MPTGNHCWAMKFYSRKKKNSRTKTYVRANFRRQVKISKNISYKYIVILDLS